MVTKTASRSLSSGSRWLVASGLALGLGIVSLFHCSSGGGSSTGCVERPSLCGSGLTCDPMENRCVLSSADLGMDPPGDGGTGRDGSMGRPDMATPADPAAGCSTDGVCWVLPEPQGNPLASVYAHSATAIWAVGQAGTIVFFDGTSWRSQVSGVSQDLQAIFGSDPGDVWAAGAGGTLLHFDGTRWSRVDSGTTGSLQSGWASSRANAWLLSDNTPLRWDGVRWTRQAPLGFGITYRVIFGADPNTIWAAGGGGIARFDGSSWKQETLPGTAPNLRSLWVGSSKEAWAVGDSGATFHWDGTAWTRLASSAGTLWAVSGQPGGPVFASEYNGTLYRMEAGSWVQESRNPDREFYGMAALPGGGAVAVGSAGAVFHRSGTTWKSYRDGKYRNLHGVWAKDKKNVWMAGDTGTDFQYWNGSIWETQSAGPNTRIQSIHGTDTNNIWAVGWTGVIRRYTGRGWSDASIPGVTMPYLYAVWSSDSNNTWVGGSDNTLYRWNGTMWTRQTPPVSSTWLGLTGLGPNRVWAVGSGGAIVMWDGTSWRAQTSGVSTSLQAVYAVDDKNVFAVGDNGTILQWDGIAWVYRLSGTRDALYDVVAASESDAWAVGEYGRILHWDGKAWSNVASPSAQSAYGVTLADPKGDSTLWVVGGTGSVLTRKKDGVLPTLRQEGVY